ncbi:hypothetical protein EV670_1094 [Rivibacter subsaxonicus]|uniref:PIN domain-containing protein n=1 Tax=Rivibacter subsaxonicus TaxID=457575 RepID=A0A4Q7W1F1_9BURK|nr:hypothetical protein EV670_1094 [Rivibacter subsaxonicus]
MLIGTACVEGSVLVTCDRNILELAWPILGDLLLKA